MVSHGAQVDFAATVLLRACTTYVLEQAKIFILAQNTCRNMLAPCIVHVKKTLVEVEPSSAVAGLLADAISATADALALAASGVLPA